MNIMQEEKILLMPDFISVFSYVEPNLMQNIINLKDEVIDLKDIIIKNLQDKNSRLKTKLHVLESKQV